MPSTATITSFNVFSAQTLIRSSQVNSNFSIFRGHSLPLNTDTATASDNTYDLGAVDHRWNNIYGNVAVLTQQSTPAANPTTTQFKVYMKSDGILYRLNSAGNESAVTTGVPLTTKGDLAVHDGIATVRLPIGSNGQFLTADSSATSGMKWAVSGSKVYRSVTTTDTCTSADDILELSGASFTETLFTAVGNSGKELTIKHGGTSLTQVYTIDGNGSETIGGSTTFALYTNGETLKIVSDGSNWKILDHYAKTDFADAGVTTLEATTTNPTKGTIVVDRVMWRRDGEFAEIKFEYQATTAGAAGSGTYLLGWPSSIGSVDTTKVTANTALTTSTRGVTKIGTIGGANSTAETLGNLYLYSSTRVWAALHQTGSASGANWGSGFLNLAGTDVNFSAIMKVPISGWKS